MIIVEGADGSGKTHVVSTISRMFDLTVTKFGGPPRDDAEGTERLQRLFTQVPDDVVLDRSPITSEFVYGHVLRGTTRPPEQELLAAVPRLRDKNPLIIFCRPPTSDGAWIDRTTKKSWKPEALLNEVVQKFDKVIERYETLFEILKYFNFDIFEWQVTQGDPAALIGKVAAYVYARHPDRWYPGRRR